MSPSRRDFLASSLAFAALRPAGPALGGEGRGHVPWLAEVQRPPAKLPPDAPSLPPLLPGGGVATLEAWKARRAELRKAWLDFLGTLDGPPPEPRLTVLDEDRPRGCVRQLVRYETEPGLPVEAYLLKPAEGEGQCPGVVAFHATTGHTIRVPAGLAGGAERHCGPKLARGGVVTLCPKNFLWVGEGGYKRAVARFQERHPGARGMAKMLWDAQRAVDVLAAVPQVDGRRLGAVGHSLGGKEVLYLAAFDQRVRTAVSSEGGVGIAFSNWDAPWYLGEGVHEQGFARRHHELLALVAPRAFLLLGGDAADGARSWPYVEAALRIYRLYGGTPRIGLYRHGKGHSIPPEAERRLHQWLQATL
ncbi:MAG: dienelactone hydrolase family protein [Candidatus Brocadiia bacterium]